MAANPPAACADDPRALVFLVLIVAANVTWYRMKYILRDRGYGIPYLSHIQDIPHFRELIAKERDPVRRARHVRLQSSLYALIAALFLLVLATPFWMDR